MSRRIIIFGAVIAAVALLWSAAWLWLAGEVRNQVALLASGDGYAAPTLTCGRLDVTGYPFRFNLACGNAVIVSGDQSFALPELRAAALIFQPTLFHLAATGPLTMKDAYLGGESRLDWQTLEGSLRLADWRIQRLSLVADTLAWSDTLMTERLIATAAAAEVHLTDLPELHDDAAGLAALAGYLGIETIVAPDAAIADGQFGASLEITGLPDDLRAVGDEPLRQWQAAGGRVTLTEVKGQDGADDVTITGELGLGATGLAEGTLEVASKGLGQRFATMVPPELQPLLFGAPGPDGTSSQRLTIANGLVFVGLVPVFGLPALF